MSARGCGEWSHLCVLFSVAAVAGCSSSPTGPSTPTPTPTATIATCTAGQPMTSFTATPSTITTGDTFTLNWTAPCGFVSLARAGQSPFAMLQPSSGSYQVPPSSPGYPTGTGTVSYEAKNGDTATPIHTTVTVNPKATPTPAAAPTVSLSPTSGTTCHPIKRSGVVTACSVNFNASGTGYTSLAWSGCCSGSTGTPGACRINDITSTFTCTVTATGDGGTASANGTATGINSPPFLGSTPTYSPSAPLPENTVVWANYDANDPDGDGYSCVRTRACGGPCGSIDTCSIVPSLTSQGQVRFDTGSSAGTCCWGVQWTDEWGAITNSPNFSVPVQ